MKRSFYIIAAFLVLVSLYSFLVDTSSEIGKSIENERIANLDFDQEGNCKECHSSLFEKKFLHAPMEESCEDCHIKDDKPHPDAEGKNFSLAEKGSELCLICHDVKTKKNIHYPVSEESCIICHSPHSSDYKKLLIKNPVSQLCFDCHDPEKTENRIAHKPYKDGDCSKCHDAHESDFKFFMKKETSKLCMECHKETIWKEFNSEEQVKKSLNIHAAIEIDGCSTCHKPHTSDFNSLLTSSFPDGLYAPAKTESFALCFECHDSEMLKEDASDVTGFKNKKTNLHYIHIRGEKGRSCKDCHDMHSSTNEHLILNKLKFGNWEMPMNFESNENGGSCAPGCHSKTIYVK